MNRTGIAGLCLMAGFAARLLGAGPPGAPARPDLESVSSAVADLRGRGLTLSATWRLMELMEWFPEEAAALSDLLDEMAHREERVASDPASGPGERFYAEGYREFFNGCVEGAIGAWSRYLTWASGGEAESPRVREVREFLAEVRAARDRRIDRAREARRGNEEGARGRVRDRAREGPGRTPLPEFDRLRAREYHKEAMRAYRLGRIEQAADLSRAALRLDPASEESRKLLSKTVTSADDASGERP